MLNVVVAKCVQIVFCVTQLLTPLVLVLPVTDNIFHFALYLSLCAYIKEQQLPDDPAVGPGGSAEARGNMGPGRTIAYITIGFGHLVHSDTAAVYRYHKSSCLGLPDTCVWA